MSITTTLPIIMGLSLGNLSVKFVQKDPNVLVKQVGASSALIQTPTGSGSITMVIGNQKLVVLPGSDVQINVNNLDSKTIEQTTLGIQFSKGSGTIESAPPIPGGADSRNTDQASNIKLQIITPQGTIPFSSSGNDASSSVTANTLGTKALIVVGQDISSVSIEKGGIFSPTRSASQGSDNTIASQGQTLILGKSNISVVSTPPDATKTVVSQQLTNSNSRISPEFQPPILDSQAKNDVISNQMNNGNLNSLSTILQSRLPDPSSLSPFIVRPPQLIPNVNQPSGGNAILNIVITPRVN